MAAHVGVLLRDSQQCAPKCGVRVVGRMTDAHAGLLDLSTMEFITELHRTFEQTRQELLQRRSIVQERFDRGAEPKFLSETRDIRESDWTIAPVPEDLVDRRVEIVSAPTGTALRASLQSDASVIVPDLEDSTSPTWANIMEGHAAIAQVFQIHRNEPNGHAALIVKPRGLHLDERHVEVDRQPVAATFFDIGVLLFHQANPQVQSGSGIYLYVPKIETHLEARLWNDIFTFTEEYLGITQGSIRATALIETVPAAFEMEEILWELKEHAAGLAFGYSDYLFSLVKTSRANPERITSARADIPADQLAFKALAELMVQTCHLRGAHAVGPVAAHVAPTGDAAAHERVLDAIRLGARRDVAAGFDGTAVSDPSLVPIARQIFDQHVAGVHQRHRIPETAPANARCMVQPEPATVTESGVRDSVTIGVTYLEGWLRGAGLVPLHDRLEDTAAAEFCRAQVWHWVHHRTALDDGRSVTPALVRGILVDVLNAIRKEQTASAFASSQFALAARIYEQLVLADEFGEWLTTAAYEYLIES